jgi:hypothetical protein
MSCLVNDFFFVAGCKVKEKSVDLLDADLLGFDQALRTAHFFFLVGSFFRLVFATSRSCFSDMDLAICLEAPFKLDFFRSPRFAAKAAPAAICCFFERAGIYL